MARDEELVEIIVLPRRRLWHGGAVHLPGARLKVTLDEFDDLTLRRGLNGRTVALATDEIVAAVADALARRLPVLAYEPPMPGEDDDVLSDPRKLGPRVAGRKAAKAKDAEPPPSRPRRRSA